MNKLFDYEISDPLVKRLKKSRRKRVLVAKVQRVNNAEKEVNSLLGDIF